MDRCRRRPGMNRTAVMNKESKGPEWVIRQGFACVWVQAPSAEAAVRRAADRLGHMGGWKVGPHVDQEVFRGEEYVEQRWVHEDCLEALVSRLAAEPPGEPLVIAVAGKPAPLLAGRACVQRSRAARRLLPRSHRARGPGARSSSCKAPRRCAPRAQDGLLVPASLPGAGAHRGHCADRSQAPSSRRAVAPGRDGASRTRSSGDES